MYKIGYIDEDKGWRNTFYQYFKEEFDIILFEIDNSTTVENLITRIYDENLDELIIDFRLDESGLVNFNGNAIVEKILVNNPHFPILMLTSYEQDAIDHVDNVNIINAKDILEGEKPEKVEVLKSKISSIIKNYYSKIGKSEKRIEELIEKRDNTHLQLNEEEELTRLYVYLDEINPKDKTIPVNLLQPESITRLNEFVLQTKEILEHLKNRKND